MLIRRLLALSWRYRWGCLRVLALQSPWWASNLGLGFTGLGVDEIRHAAGALKARTGRLAGRPPPGWTPWERIVFVAGLVRGFAAIRAVIDGLSRHETNYLVQGQIVVQMRADIYAKLQQLSFRFYDANASSSIINRVTATCRACGCSSTRCSSRASRWRSRWWHTRRICLHPCAAHARVPGDDSAALAGVLALLRTSYSRGTGRTATCRTT